jgi:hypothetical protein
MFVPVRPIGGRREGSTAGITAPMPASMCTRFHLIVKKKSCQESNTFIVTVYIINLTTGAMTWSTSRLKIHVKELVKYKPETVPETAGLL